MADDDGTTERRLIIDRANRMLKQSHILRKMSDELLQESQDLRKSAAKLRSRKRQSPRKSR